MQRVARRRRPDTGLLTRRPQIDPFVGDEAGHGGIDWVDQLRQVLELYDRGLVSLEEVRRQQAAALRED